MPATHQDGIRATLGSAVTQRPLASGGLRNGVPCPGQLHGMSASELGKNEEGRRGASDRAARPPRGAPTAHIRHLGFLSQLRFRFQLCDHARPARWQVMAHMPEALPP